MSNRERIQNALVDAALAGTFNAVTYDDSHKASVGAAVVPCEVFANEVSASFEVPRRNRRQRGREKVRWEWALHVNFDGEASTEAFEVSLNEKPIILSRTGTDPQIELLLRDAIYTHPPTQDPKTGTKVRYVFIADIYPI